MTKRRVIRFFIDFVFIASAGYAIISLTNSIVDAILASLFVMTYGLFCFLDGQGLIYGDEK